jgi:exodeoxyribonuclease VII large subunit
MGLKPIKVSQLNSYIKRVLQNDPLLGRVSVVGEVSNLKFHSTGHVYFSLKDETSKVSCFLPSNLVPYIDCQLKEGMEITAHGYIYVYERGGSYSINIKSIEESGKGQLAERFEKLKAKLAAEGMFDPAHKKELTFFPHKVAVVTSETGAAVRDILKIIKKKNDYVDILIYPVLVQGPSAPPDIASAIDDINANHRDVDVIITGRGGGSMEELWAFNEEIVARSIYNSDIPVISAVGHETDFTIADFVADVSAETPTAAADMAVPDTWALRDDLQSIQQDLKRNLRVLADSKYKHLEMFNPTSFKRDLQGRIALEQMRTENIIKDMAGILREEVILQKNKINLCKEALEAANPKNILSKGYSLVTDDEGNVVTDATALSRDQVINIEMTQGKVHAQVIDTEER